MRSHGRTCPGATVRRVDGTCVKARPRVAVLGDGLEGLACAHYLKRSGIAVSVFSAPEPSRELAGRFLHGSIPLERFHATIQPSDSALLGLVNDLEGSHCLLWRRGSSVLREGKRLERSPWLERVHGALALRGVVRYGRYARGMDQLGARSWLCRWVGERVFEQSLEPLLRAQLGEIDDEVCAGAAWRALCDLTDPSERRVGYLRGGTSALLNALRESLRESRVELAGDPGGASWRVRPSGIELSSEAEPRRFDALVTTVPAAELAPATAAEDPGARWDTLISVALVVRSELALPYRSVCADPSRPVGTSYRSDVLIPREDTGGLRVHYFTRRARAGQPLEPREVLEKQAWDCLRSLAGGSSVPLEAATVSTARVPVPVRRARVPGPAAPTSGPLFVSRPDAHASGAGTELEAAVLAARRSAEQVQSYLRQRA